jgi:hypothetical protein
MAISYIFPTLVYCIKKNLATLVLGLSERRLGIIFSPVAGKPPFVGSSENALIKKK